MKKKNFFGLCLSAMFLQACGSGNNQTTDGSRNAPQPPSSDTGTTQNSIPSLNSVHSEKTSIESPAPTSVSIILENPDSSAKEDSSSTSATPMQKKAKKKRPVPHPKVKRSLANELEQVYEEGRNSSSSDNAALPNDLTGYKSHIITLKLDDHSEKKISVFIPNEIGDQFKAIQEEQTLLLSGPKNPQQLAKIMLEKIPNVMKNLIYKAKIGDVNFEDSLNHTVQDLNNTALHITEEVRKALEVSLIELAKKITSEFFEVENLIENGGAESSLGMRHSENGGIDETPDGGERTPINLPIFIKLDKTALELSSTNFIKLGKMLFGTKQKFNSQDHSLKSLDFITTLMMKNAFLEAKLGTSKYNISNYNQVQYTLGYDFIEHGVTPFVQIVSSRYSQAYWGVSMDVYKKDSGLLRYSLLGTAKVGKILKEDSPVFGTLNACGTIDLYNGLSLLSSVKLAPQRSEIKLSIGFSQ